MKSVNVNKNYLFNLIIYTQDLKRKEYFENLIHNFTKRFPCRILFIQKSADDTTIACSSLTQYLMTPSDQMIIGVPEKALGKVPYIALPYLIPDLPIYLFWGQDPTADRAILPYLEKFADRVVFDTDNIDELAPFCQTLLKTLPLYTTLFVDLDWVSINDWRRILSQIFNSPEKLQQLTQMTNVTIGYAQNHGRRHSSRRVLYLQAWLSAQMNWSLKNFNKNSATYQTEQGECSIRLVPQENPTYSPGALLYLNMEDAGQSSYQLSRSEDKISVRCSSAQQCDMPYSLSLHKKDHSLTFMKEIFYYPISSHYKKMVEMLAYGHTSSYPHR